MAGKEAIVVLDGVPRARRWVWFEDWRSWMPFYFPLSFRGDFGWFPDVLNVKKTLLKEVSTFRAAFGEDDTAKLVLHGVNRDAFQESFRLNEDPQCTKLLPDNWAVNEGWALHVAVLWPMPDSSMSCDQSTSYDVKKQIATERGHYYDDQKTKWVDYGGGSSSGQKDQHDEDQQYDQHYEAQQYDEQQDESSRESKNSWQTMDQGKVSSSRR